MTRKVPAVEFMVIPAVLAAVRVRPSSPERIKAPVEEDQVAAPAEVRVKAPAGRRPRLLESVVDKVRSVASLVNFK